MESEVTVYDDVYSIPELLTQGFFSTLLLAVVAGIFALVWGTVLGAFRVSPVGPLRTLGAVYVTVIRNSPLTLIFLFLGATLSAMFGIVIPIARDEVFGVTINNGIIFAIVALSIYTSAFVCEVVRSGVNSVPQGQAEAARSIGMTFTQTLGNVVLPQALRAVVPPMISVFVAHVKNTSVAAGFAATELVASANRLANQEPGSVVWIFAGVGLLYALITIPMGFASSRLEKKWAIVR